MNSKRRSLVAAVVVLVTLRSGPAIRAQQRPVDVARSTLTVFVYKSGLFAAFADNHTIKAPIASGSLVEGESPSIELSIRAGDLTVVDRELSADKRAEVQSRMVSAEVLDVAKFPTITFASTSIKPTASDRWSVSGTLTLHGRTQPITFTVTRADRRYRGEVVIKQRDFGIEPIRVAGGTVRVKDEVKVAFEIVGGS